MPVKLSEIKAGDILVADGGFTCLSAGDRREVKSADDELYIECAEGKHYLDGQARDDDTLIGLARAAAKASA